MINSTNNHTWQPLLFPQEMAYRYFKENPHLVIKFTYIKDAILNKRRVEHPKASIPEAGSKNKQSK